MLFACLLIAVALPPKITISKETTYALKPLRADGVIDYIGAVNALYDDVKPDENAALVLVQAFGPRVTQPALAEEYFQRLRCKPPPALDGKYFQTVLEYAKEHDDLDIRDEAEKRQIKPWSTKESPAPANLLIRNSPALEIVVAASKRPKFYAPLLTDFEPPVLIYCHLSMLQQVRGAVRLLAVRAMKRIRDGDVQGASSDIDACHRFAQLIGAGPRFLIEGNVAISLYIVAMRAEQALACSGLVSQEAARGRMGKLLALKPPIDLHRTIDECERLSMLSSLAYTIVFEPAKKRRKRDEENAMMTELRGKAFDADEALRTVNKFYDRLAAAAKKSSVEEVYELCNGLSKQKREREVNDQAFFLFRKTRTHPNGPKAATGQLLGEIFLQLLTPAFPMANSGIAQSKAEQHLAVLSYALADYKKVRGRYPEKLDAKELGVPAEVLNDPMRSEPLIYRTKDGKRQVVGGGLDGRLDDEPGRQSITPPNDRLLELP